MSRTSRPGVLLVNLGTPGAPTPSAVRRYLREFLLDRRVVEAPRLTWWLLLNLIVLPRRAARSAGLYRTIWTAEGSPLLAVSRRQASRLEKLLQQRLGRPIPVVAGMRYGSPSIAEAMAKLSDRECSPIVVLPLYPQYSGSTIGSVFDAVAAELVTWRHVPGLRFISGYHDEPGYIAALAASIREAWRHHGRPVRLLISYHGIPERYAVAGDPYPSQCAATTELLVRELELAGGEWVLAYQSRFGREPWIGPATDRVLEQLGREGLDSVDVVCPGFAADCLETLNEIAVANRRLFEKSGGGAFHYIPALNDRADHIEALAALVERNL
ncbi:MAG: ferrochelatase [Acidobacteria bacterium]|nr:ferrochelatase [Acidobacteriota bacterium]